MEPIWSNLISCLFEWNLFFLLAFCQAAGNVEYDEKTDKGRGSSSWAFFFFTWMYSKGSWPERCCIICTIYVLPLTAITGFSSEANHFLTFSTTEKPPSFLRQLLTGPLHQVAASGTINLMPAATRCRKSKIPDIARLSRLFVSVFLGGKGSNTWKAGESWKLPQKTSSFADNSGCYHQLCLNRHDPFYFDKLRSPFVNKLLSCALFSLLQLVQGNPNPRLNRFHGQKHAGHPWTRIFPLLKQSFHRELHMEQLHLPGANKQIKHLQSVRKLRGKFKKHVKKPMAGRWTWRLLFLFGWKFMESFSSNVSKKVFEIFSFIVSLWLEEGVNNSGCPSEVCVCNIITITTVVFYLLPSTILGRVTS